jgi:2-polyprenyl-3-methyl-5-hydroxy-6-metoxy-1,4-benzoquinol methylase
MSQFVIRGGREGYERLQLLARARRGDTLDLLEHVGFPTDARCLDHGCGGGEVTFELARLADPAGQVVGLDMDEIKLDLARNAAQERGIANVEFRAGNVNQWSDPAAYDLIYSRFLLQHLSQPRELVKRMWAAVRPGGPARDRRRRLRRALLLAPQRGFLVLRAHVPARPRTAGR